MTFPFGGASGPFVPKRRPLHVDTAVGDGYDHLLFYAVQRGFIQPRAGAGYLQRTRVLFADAPIDELADNAIATADLAENARVDSRPPGHSNSHPVASAAAAPQHSVRQAWRPLFQEPGLRRVVRWGDFRPMIAAQLARPDRLRDGHRLPCYVQLYEITRPISLDQLASGLLQRKAGEGELQLLTLATARQLDLAALAEPATHARPSRREPGQMLPYDRVLRLTAALDPTVDARFRGAETTASANDGAIAAPEEHPRAAVVQPPADTALALRREVPSRYQRPWECRLTREEATYDMTASETFGSSVSLVRRLVNALTRHGAMRRWRTLLRGRSLDEQLWLTRPPGGVFERVEVREWARRTLTLAGYDPAMMLHEWEIFWRQRGV